MRIAKDVAASSLIPIELRERILQFTESDLMWFAVGAMAADAGELETEPCQMPEAFWRGALVASGSEVVWEDGIPKKVKLKLQGSLLKSLLLELDVCDNSILKGKDAAILVDHIGLDEK